MRARPRRSTRSRAVTHRQNGDGMSTAFMAFIGLLVLLFAADLYLG